MSKIESADKRSVFTDALETLGTIVDVQQKRDAVHIAVVHLAAKVVVYPGQHIDANGLPNSTDSKVGIVDPYLTGPVYPGQLFWLMIYPRKINSLRHVWSHPEFTDEIDGSELLTDTIKVNHSTRVQPVESQTLTDEIKDKADKALIKLESYANDIGVDADELMGAASNFLRSGEYWVQGGRFEGEYLDPAFWESYEILTGEIVPENKKHSFLSCSC